MGYSAVAALLYKGNDENTSSCGFTHFPAASKLITLPRRSSFEHEIKGEKWEILSPLTP
jgi:hypothetical protein